ncbi:putative bifunctional diguanylate cyclase/phosphodiesterase [Microvirga arabica]|uniref:putative bifunctional diguanylate cyclase/phosphodiesterase n=1 Tax=Microvirga arabica TaxID=1128671 RepID=UPI00193AA516|nr:EAL domain-containing protein [Microvirga arabica]MBM1172790.1 EAL domain-containing protein [Microvirga arabica]
MRNEAFSINRAGLKVSGKALPLIAVITLIALGLAALAVYWAVRQSDAAAIDRQLQMTERSVRGILRELSLQQEVVAVWDDPILQLNKTNLDIEWLDENLGSWLTRTYGHDQVYILNAQDEPVFAAVDGALVEPRTFGQIERELGIHLSELRETQGPLHENSARSAQDGKYLTSGRAVYDAHLLKLTGRPAAVSAMKIVPHSDEVMQQSGSEFILVSIRFLDGAFLRQLSEKNLIEGLRFSLTEDKAGAEVSVPLDSDAGGRIGYFVWTPETPGTKILGIIGPAGALFSVLILVLMGLLLGWLARAMSALQTMVVELRASEAQAQHLAFHDVLTGLPNRALFDDRLDQALARTQRGEKISVLMLDLDRFKHVNDTLGHHAGDSLIRELAGRLTKLLRSSDTVARLGGDEFAIVQTGIAGDEDIDALCTRILAAVREPFDILDHQAFVGVSIGIAVAPDAGSERVEIMRKADIALYRAKAEGRGCYRLFTAEMDETVKVRGTIEEELRVALMSGEGLEVAYQPQVAGAGKPIVGLEALVRWRHPTRGVILPDQFIPVAEQTGLISQLGEWVLREACATSRHWPNLFISVNLSPVQFRIDGFAERVMEVVRETGVDPRRIELEITEGVLLDDGGQTAQTLRKLRAAGFRIALDDFGTGYSSLGYLHRYEVDKIKIDRSFVSSLGREDSAGAIISAIVALGQAMNLTVTAEGVETREQEHFLRSAGCDELQGYRYFRALTREQVARLLDHAPQPEPRGVLTIASSTI